MQAVIILSVLVAAALAAPAAVQSGQDRDAQVLRYDNNNIGVEGFNYEYAGSNGIEAREEGSLKNVGQENEALVVRGSYSYTGPDGVVYTVNYIADENGFQPQGAHLPQAPVA